MSVVNANPTENGIKPEETSPKSSRKHPATDQVTAEFKKRGHFDKVRKDVFDSLLSSVRTGHEIPSQLHQN